MLRTSSCIYSRQGVRSLLIPRNYHLKNIFINQRGGSTRNVTNKRGASVDDDAYTDIFTNRSIKEKDIPYVKEQLVRSKYKQYKKVSFQGTNDTEVFIDYSLPSTELRKLAIEILFAISRRSYDPTYSVSNINWSTPNKHLPICEVIPTLNTTTTDIKSLNKFLLHITFCTGKPVIITKIEKVLKVVLEECSEIIDKKGLLSSIAFLYYHSKWTLFNELRDKQINKTETMNITFYVEALRKEIYGRSFESRIIKSLEYMLVNSIPADRTTWSILLPLLTDNHSISTVYKNMVKYDIKFPEKTYSLVGLSAKSDPSIILKLYIFDQLMSRGDIKEAINIINTCTSVNDHVLRKIVKYFINENKLHMAIAFTNFFEKQNKLARNANGVLMEVTGDFLLESKYMLENENWINIIKYVLYFNKPNKFEGISTSYLEKIIETAKSTQPEYVDKTNDECKKSIFDFKSIEFTAFKKQLDHLCWNSIDTIELKMNRNTQQFQEAALLLHPRRAFKIENRSEPSLSPYEILMQNESENNNNSEE